MARPIRIHYPEERYHVMARGSHGQAVFGDNADRQKFRETLGEACEKIGWCIPGGGGSAVHYLDTPLRLQLHTNRLSDQASVVGDTPERRRTLAGASPGINRGDGKAESRKQKAEIGWPSHPKVTSMRP